MNTKARFIAINFEFKTQALNELGYTSINENNAKEVFEKIAEIMSRKF